MFLCHRVRREHRNLCHRVSANWWNDKCQEHKNGKAERRPAPPPADLMGVSALTPDEIDRLSRPVRRAVRYIHDNYARPLPLSEIAEAAGKSKRHVERLFRRELGVSPIGYLQRYRILRAADTLHSDPSQSAEHLALNAGYESVPYFVQLFQRHACCTVRAYKAALRNPPNGGME